MNNCCLICLSGATLVISCSNTLATAGAPTNDSVEVVVCLLKEYGG